MCRAEASRCYSTPSRYAYGSVPMRSFTLPHPCDALLSLGSAGAWRGAPRPESLISLRIAHLSRRHVTGRQTMPPQRPTPPCPTIALPNAARLGHCAVVLCRRVPVHRHANAAANPTRHCPCVMVPCSAVTPRRTAVQCPCLPLPCLCFPVDFCADAVHSCSVPKPRSASPCLC